MIAGIVLAAGRGERFGSDKLLRSLGDRPLILHAVGHCVASSLDRIVIVVGDPAGDLATVIRDAFGDDARVSIVGNPNAARGHMTSVQAGLRALPDGTDAAAIVLGDMPFVSARIIDQLIDEQRRAGGFVVPSCEGSWRHPRLIPAVHFADFEALAEDAGGGGIFERFRAEVHAINVGAPWNYLDVDTADDLNRAQRLLLS